MRVRDIERKREGEREKERVRERGGVIDLVKKGEHEDQRQR